MPSHAGYKKNMKKNQRSSRKVNLAAEYFVQPEKPKLPFVCASVKNGFPCAYGEDCKFGHTLKEVETGALNRMCKGKDSCWHKHDCSYYHPEENLEDFLCRLNNCDVHYLFGEKKGYSSDLLKLVPSQVLRNNLKKKKKIKFKEETISEGFTKVYTENVPITFTINRNIQITGDGKCILMPNLITTN